MPVLRFDTGAIKSFERTPQGGLRVRAALAKTGTLDYADTAGREWTEYRPATALDAAAIASLRGAPVTLRHPPVMVTADNFREHARGHVADDVGRDGDYLVATLVINDAETVAGIEDGSLKDVSIGYHAELDATPGTAPDGTRFDAVQTAIRGNHAALLPPGAGRAGPDVGLRLDGAGYLVPSTPARGHARADSSRTETQSMGTKTITYNGKAYRCDDDGEMASLEKDAAEDKKKYDADGASKAAQIDAVMKQLAAVLADCAQLQAKLKALEAATAEEEAAAGEPMGDAEGEPVPEEVLDAAGVKRPAGAKPLRVPTKVIGVLVDRHLALRADAGKVLGDAYDFAGKGEAEIHRAVIAHVAPKLDTARFDAKGLAAMYAGIVAARAEAATASAHRDVQVAANATDAAGKPRQDGGDVKTLGAAYADLQKRAEARGRAALGTTSGGGH
jgi:hypothetical protein